MSWNPQHKLEPLSVLTAFSLGDVCVLWKKLVFFITELNTVVHDSEKLKKDLGEGGAVREEKTFSFCPSKLFWLD